MNYQLIRYTLSSITDFLKNLILAVLISVILVDPITCVDLCSIYRVFKPHCKRIDIATNGSLKTPKYFENLANILKRR